MRSNMQIVSDDEVWNLGVGQTRRNTMAYQGEAIQSGIRSCEMNEQ